MPDIISKIKQEVMTESKIKECPYMKKQKEQREQQEKQEETKVEDQSN